MKSRNNKITTYIFLIVIGFILIYPLIWLLSASIKPSSEIFKSLNIIPSKIMFEAYINGWNGTGQYSFGRYFFNAFLLVIPTVLFTIFSSSIVAYGFARFRFPFKKSFFIIMLSTLMLPDTVIIIPRYMLFKKLDWLNSYMPFYMPALFACTPFFIFMMVQFLRGVPNELDESATIDGCNSLQLFWKILLPLSKPAIFSMMIFQFIWTWNDFFNVLIYVNSVKKYTLPIALSLLIDSESVVNWNQVAAMSIVSILPPVLLFFFAQKYFVEGIATSGIKG